MTDDHAKCRQALEERTRERDDATAGLNRRKGELLELEAKLDQTTIERDEAIAERDMWKAAAAVAGQRMRVLADVATEFAR